MEKSKKFIKELNDSSTSGKTIVTRVDPLEEFYPAEKHNQDYYEKNPEKAYCQIVINPKLQKVKREFAKLLKK
jgi:peptide-methionine (S)-S-oxide reductase